jgi:flagellar biosynthetic protein FlhB
MAETPDGMEKSEQPTGKKLGDARDRGLVAKSVDLTSAAVLLFGGLIVFGFGNSLSAQLMAFMKQLIINAPGVVLNEENIPHYYGQLAGLLGIILLPILFLIAGIALIAEVRQVGFHFASKKFTEGLNIAQMFNVFGGIKKMLFSSRSFFELGKSIVKLLIIGTVLYTVLDKRIEGIVGISSKPYQEIGAFMVSITTELLWKIGLAYLAIALGDYYFQKWKFNEDQKMTKREVKDESKQSEGDPQIKQRIRALGRQRLKKIMLMRTKQADVVITNPTHYAVALAYKPDSMSAPIVLAKGSDYLALKMREIAKDNKVPIVENPPLARALYAACEPDQEIPEKLFKAVAEVLAYIYRLKK